MVATIKLTRVSRQFVTPEYPTILLSVVLIQNLISWIMVGSLNFGCFKMRLGIVRGIKIQHAFH